MSRSNPTENNPNPSERWFEWKGGDGKFTYYDKDKKESVDVKLPFRFLVLDQLSTITGYNKKAKSGIHANEIKDVSSDPFVVKFFTGEQIAAGLWSEIKEKVAYAKGKFANSCYIAFKDGAELKIGNIRWSGCALGPWFDFTKKNRTEINTKAVCLTAGEEDTTGDVTFTPPEFSIIDTTPETDDQAKELDRKLQQFLAGYFKKSGTVVADGNDNLPGEDGPPLDQREEPEMASSMDDDDQGIPL
jgi:hypothetical protein